MTDNTCSACQGVWPRKDHFIAELSITKAYLHDDQFFPGWTVLVLKKHATELFQLTADERRQLIEEVAAVAHVLAEEYRAAKINYELLGNQLPHIHWHVIPRLASDPAPLEPVWRVTHQPKRLQQAELEGPLLRVRARLQSHVDGRFFLST